MDNCYENPLATRYASDEMQEIFSADKKFSTWRKLWLALAESEKELGLEITDAQISQMRDNLTNIDYKKAAEYESKVRHDVMAHVKTFGDVAPLARPIIHLGATSCFVGDNTDVIVQREALLQIKRLLVTVIEKLYLFADKHKDVACLGWTHFQAAQPVTVGKRATLWLQDLLFDLEQLNSVISNLKFFGCKGATGTAASFLNLFNGDDKKVVELERKIAGRMGFEDVYPITAQTYSRKLDYFILSVLSGIAQSAHKFSNDIRLLSNLKEVDEPFEDGQIGSSAMPYKRNPMRSERIASLSRFVIVGTQNTALTAATQWLERTLDDSANRRIVIPETFMAVDAILQLYSSVIGGLILNVGMIKKHLNEELPFLATENILMHCVKKGGDRQTLHEAIRVHSVQAGKQIKSGGQNDLFDKILGDSAFKITKAELDSIINVDQFTGRSKQQVEEFLKTVSAVLSANESFLGASSKIKV